MNGPTNGIAGQTRSERCRVADTNQPHPYNPAVPFSLDPVEAVRVNLSAAERRTASLAGRRTVKKQWQAAWLVRALQCIDLTTLNGDDTEGRVRRLCAKARHPLRADLQEALGLADRAIMSERTFARSFRAQTGMTPARYVELVRLDRAKQLLESTRWPLARIAERAGLGSASTLSRAFCRHLGTTPEGYRERFRIEGSRR